MTKTMGIYQITSNLTPEFKFIGFSTQIEVCTKDYMSWCKKGKGPKRLQDEYDIGLLSGNYTTEQMFTVTILKVCTTQEEFALAKAEFGLSTGGSKTSNNKCVNIVKGKVNKEIPEALFSEKDRIECRGKYYTIIKITEKNVIMKRDNYKFFTEIPLQHLKTSGLYHKLPEPNLSELNIWTQIVP